MMTLATAASRRVAPASIMMWCSNATAALRSSRLSESRISRAPSIGCMRMIATSSAMSAPGFCTISNGTFTLPRSCSNPRGSGECELSLER